METVLVIGATGNIGHAAIQAALKSGRHVLAVVRNEASANKLWDGFDKDAGITVVKADITSEDGIKGVVEKVKAGQLLAFQHVCCSAGGAYDATAIEELTLDDMRRAMTINFETNFLAYRDTIGYLREQRNPLSTWTLCNGAQGDLADRAGPAISQGAMYSLATVAIRDNANTNVRFNEIYLNARVEVDHIAKQHGTMPASTLSPAYEQIMARQDIKGCRIYVNGPDDASNLRFHEKRPGAATM